MEMNQNGYLLQVADEYIDAIVETNTIMTTYEDVSVHIAPTWLLYFNHDTIDIDHDTTTKLVQLTSGYVNGILEIQMDGASNTSQSLVHLVSDTQSNTTGTSSTETPISDGPIVQLVTNTPYHDTITQPTETLVESYQQQGLDFYESLVTSTNNNASIASPAESHYVPLEADEDLSSLTNDTVEKTVTRETQDKSDAEKVKATINQLKEDYLRETYLDPIRANIPPTPEQRRQSGIPLTPPDHYRGTISKDDRHVYRTDKKHTTDDYQYIESIKNDNDRQEKAVRSEFIAVEKEPRAMHVDHWEYDINEPESKENQPYQSDGNRKFHGSHTALYNEAEQRAKYMHLYGLDKHEKKYYGDRALSALDPFTRLDNPEDARQSNLYTYNRTKLPVADLEWRKGFRHIFITRPECYILTPDLELCDQCYNDELFYSSFLRMPHVSYLLSPSYITCQNENDFRYGDNFNYLLSNRVMGLSVVGTEIDQVSSMQKATTGASVVPGAYINNDYGSSLNLTFRDTKHLDVYECLRLWIRYIHNIYGGTFAVSFHPNYPATNTYNFASAGEDGRCSIKNVQHLHPYDRALDYCATIFDVVTNEAGTKILYWCKYIGVYPTSATPTNLTNSTNEAITSEQSISARFYYQGKEEYLNKSLVEFNYNAGIVDRLGRPYETRSTFSLPYLLRNDYLPKQTDRNSQYLGAAGMFTGRPYIVLNGESDHYMRRNRLIPQLRFMRLVDNRINVDKNGNYTGEGVVYHHMFEHMNVGIENNVTEESTETRVAIYDDTNTSS